MPWCPKCGCEYVSGISECADCGCELTEQNTVPEPRRKGGWPKCVPEMTLMSLLFPVLTFTVPTLIVGLFIKLFPDVRTPRLNDFIAYNAKYVFVLLALIYGRFRKEVITFSAIAGG